MILHRPARPASRPAPAPRKPAAAAAAMPDSQLAELIEAALHADARGGSPNAAIGAVVRHRCAHLGAEERAALRERAKAEYERIKAARAPGWARGGTFDDVRRRQVSKSAAHRQAAATRRPRHSARPVGLETGDCPVSVDEGIVYATNPIMVVVEGKFGWLGVQLLADPAGRVRTAGELDEAMAHALLEWLLERPGARLGTNRASR